MFESDFPPTDQHCHFSCFWGWVPGFCSLLCHQLSDLGPAAFASGGARGDECHRWISLWFTVIVPCPPPLPAPQSLGRVIGKEWAKPNFQVQQHPHSWLLGPHVPMPRFTPWFLHSMLYLKQELWGKQWLGKIPQSATCWPYRVGHLSLISTARAEKAACGGTHLYSQRWDGEGKQNLGAHWPAGPASLAYLKNSRPARDPALNKNSAQHQ